MIPLLCLGPRQRSRAASSVRDALQYHGTRSAPSLGFKSRLRVSGDGFTRCQEENEKILGLTACSLSALGKVSFCFAPPRAESSLAYTGRRDQEGARVPFRAASSSACASAWLSWPVAHCEFLPRNDSDSPSTFVGAWICSDFCMQIRIRIHASYSLPLLYVHRQEYAP